MEENMKRILVVDDEQDLCEILKFNLETEGYEVETANSAEEALEMDIASFDLLLLDVMMGGMSGFQLAKQLKGNPMTANVPIIFLTARDTENDTVTGSHKIAFRTDVKKADADYASYDGIVLPGGMPGTTHLMEDETVNRVIREFASEGKLVAAICAAPSVLGNAGLLAGKTATCYPGVEGKLTGADFVTDPVAKDGNIITSRGLGTAIDFAAEIVAYLKDQEAAKSMKESKNYYTSFIIVFSLFLLKFI